MNKKLLVFSILLFSLGTSYAQDVDALMKALGAMKTDASLKDSGWSFCLKSCSTGNTLATYNENMSLIPASSMKLITGGVAMNILGPDYHFVTKLEEGAFPTDSIEYTDFFITGDGDPSFCSTDMDSVMSEDSVFAKWLPLIRAKPCHGIICDDTYFEDNYPPAQWQWEDLGNYYGAAATGLNYHENYYSLYFETGKKGSAAQVTHTDPYLPGLELDNHVKAGGNSDNAYIFGSPFDDYREITGTVPANQDSFAIKGSMAEPADWLAYKFADYLSNNDVHFSMVNTYTDAMKDEHVQFHENKNDRDVLDSISSPPLKDIVAHMNDKSINLYAECLLKTMGKKMKGVGSTDSGRAAVKEFLQSKGVMLDGCDFRDGSGLSRTNLVTTNSFCDILSMFSAQTNFADFYNTISVAGVSGYVKDMFVGTPLAGNLRAKSGTMTHVKSYAGYVTLKSGELACFSFIVNNCSCSSGDVKNKFETLMKNLD